MLLTFAVMFVLSTFWAARQYKFYRIEQLRYRLFQIRDDLRDRAIDDPSFAATEDFLKTDDALTVLCSHFDHFTFFTLARARAASLYGPSPEVEYGVSPACREALRSATQILVESLQVKHLSLFPVFVWQRLRGQPKSRVEATREESSTDSPPTTREPIYKKRYVADPRTATTADFVRASDIHDDRFAAA